MKIYFARHAESQANVSRTIYNRGDQFGLTERGRAQAAVLATEMRDQHICKIYASKMLRAQQTAEIIAQAINTLVELCDDLRDFDCGIAEGRNDEQAWAMHNRVMREWLEQKNYDARIEQGESFNEMRARFTARVDQIVRAAQPNDNVIVVTHGAVSVCVLPLILKNIDHAFAFKHSSGTITNARYVLAETTPQGLICRSWYNVPVTSDK